MFGFKRVIENKTCRGSILMMMFVLASSYLFGVYVFLAIAKKAIKNTAATAISSQSIGDYSSDMPINNFE